MCSDCGRVGELSSLRIVDGLREMSLDGWHFESPWDFSCSQGGKFSYPNCNA